MNTIDRFWGKVENDAEGWAYDDCWQWIGCTVRGYGYFYWNKKQGLAHRYAYETFRGTIPHDLTIDHLCRNRSCVNPDHMEVVTRGENTLRGDTITGNLKRQTHCKRGHEFDEENTWRDKRGFRYCRSCAREKAFTLYRSQHPHLTGPIKDYKSHRGIQGGPRV